MKGFHLRSRICHYGEYINFMATHGKGVNLYAHV